MTDEEQEKHIRTYIAVTRQHFSTYHDHKAKMAYVATALYLTGASVLIVQKESELTKIFPFLVTVLAVTFFSVLTFMFTCWQLVMRYRAFVLISACDSLRIYWLQTPPHQLNITST